MPEVWRSGRPRKPAVGRATIGARVATPRKVMAIPTPTSRAWLEWETNSPSIITVTPMTEATVPMMALRVSDPDESGTGSPRAATGGILDARRAGLIDAMRLTPTPTIRATTAVRVLKTVPYDGRSIPVARKTAWRPAATPAPATIPTTAAMSPTTPASPRVDTSTCLRLAPRARRRASSRVRWATRMEKVFRMMKEPTKREIRAKINRKVVKNPSALLTCWADSLASSAPVTASYPGGSCLLTSDLSELADVPLLARRLTVSNWPTRLSRFWAVGSSNEARVAPARPLALPNLTMPETVNSWGGPWNRILTVSPTWKSYLSAVPLSMTTWSGPTGAFPSARVKPEISRTVP